MNNSLYLIYCVEEHCEMQVMIAEVGVNQSWRKVGSSAQTSVEYSCNKHSNVIYSLELSMCRYRKLIMFTVKLEMF